MFFRRSNTLILQIDSLFKKRYCESISEPV